MLTLGTEEEELGTLIPLVIIGKDHGQFLIESALNSFKFGDFSFFVLDTICVSPKVLDPAIGHHPKTLNVPNLTHQIFIDIK